MTVQGVQANVNPIGFNPISSGQYQPPPTGMDPAIWATTSTQALQGYLDPLLNPQSGLPTSHDNWALMNAQIQAAEKMAMDAQKGGIQQAENTFLKKTLRAAAWVQDKKYREAMTTAPDKNLTRPTGLGQVVGIKSGRIPYNDPKNPWTRQKWWAQVQENFADVGKPNQFTGERVTLKQYVTKSPKKFVGNIVDDIADPFVRGGWLAKGVTAIYLGVSAWDIVSSTVNTFKQSRAKNESLLHASLKSGLTFTGKSAKWLAMWAIGSIGYSIGVGLIATGAAISWPAMLAGIATSIVACVAAEKLGGFVKNMAKSLIPG